MRLLHLKLDEEYAYDIVKENYHKLEERADAAWDIRLHDISMSIPFLDDYDKSPIQVKKS
jgi:hypothetical protein